MKKKPLFIFSVILISSLPSFGGCAHSPFLPVHDEVLVYRLPLDLVYLRTLEAVDLHPDWEPDHTIKEKGLIYLRNVRYSSFADADQRTAALVLKQIGPHRTSIQLTPESQTVFGGDEILGLIKQYLSREVSRR